MRSRSDRRVKKNHMNRTDTIEFSAAISLAVFVGALLIVPLVVGADSAQIENNIRVESNTGGQSGTSVSTGDASANIKVKSKANGETVTDIQKEASGASSASVEVNVDKTITTSGSSSSATTSGQNDVSVNASTTGKNATSSSGVHQQSTTSARTRSRIQHLKQLIEQLRAYVFGWI